MIQENSFNQWIKKNWLLTLFLFVAVIFIIAFFVWNQWPLLFKPTSRALDNGGQLKAPERAIPEDNALYFVSGKIKDIKNSQIILTAFEFEENPLLKNKEFIITLGSDTGIWIMNNPSFIISKINGQVNIVVNKFPDGREGSQKVSFDKLTIGDSILAFSLSDIRDKDSFIAKEIYKYFK